MRATSESPDWQQRMKDDIGENPARFLDRFIPCPPSENSMFRARLRGIDRIRVVGAWIAAERKLRRGIDEDDLPEGVDDPHEVDLNELEIDEPGRDHVLDLLRDRREYLQEHGERDLPGMTREERRERARKQYAKVGVGEKATVRMDDDGGLSADAKLQQIRADGGGSG